ncbi:hypothetical protein AB0J28_05135 [Streptosporangium canum]|uniref:MmyB family transcriptional regulator n=1 Tax=Streptosporangium canum TaxID=324952 RepID=UPI00343E2E36
MIIRLAESLEVPIRERNELLLAAGFAPVYPQTRLDDPQLEPIRTALERILHGHLPYPAVVVDRHGDLASANTAFHALTAGVAPHLLVPPVSVSPGVAASAGPRATRRQPRRGCPHATSRSTPANHWAGSSRSIWSKSSSALGAIKEVERSRREAVVQSDR